MHSHQSALAVCDRFSVASSGSARSFYVALVGVLTSAPAMIAFFAQAAQIVS